MPEMAEQNECDAPDTVVPAGAINTGKKMQEIDKYSEESAIGFDALYDSAMKCKKGVVWKDSVAAYYHRATERTYNLYVSLLNGKYKAAPNKAFYDPISEATRNRINSLQRQGLSEKP